MDAMQIYDIIILILVGWLTLRGAIKGMISQLASIAAVIASFWAAVRFGPILGPAMQSAFNILPPWDKVFGITLAFVGASIAVMFVHRVLANLISVIRMQKYDRLLGAMFGFLKGILIGMILTFFAVMLSEQTHQLATQSRSGKILVRFIQRTQSLLPEDVGTLIEANLEGFRKQLEWNTETAVGSKDAIEVLQRFATSLVKRTPGLDPANDQPRLASTATSLRDYLTPAPMTMNYPTAPTVAENTGTSPSALSADNTIGPEPIFGRLTNPSAVPVVAPSADLQPTTSTAAAPTLTHSEIDWRALLR
ncbi:MAG: CvpA family protein, partial [Planctomycetaceae bacterium]|nr:CvpA family protein [Planctomycetaceae bacterium]